MKKKSNKNRVFNEFSISQQDLYDKFIKTINKSNLEKIEKVNIINQVDNLLDDVINDKI